MRAVGVPVSARVSLQQSPARSARSVPHFLIAMRHPTTRRYVCDLIEQHCRCWIATSAPDVRELVAALDALRPDALIIEAPVLDAAEPELAGRADHIVVVGPVADDAYRDRALEAGADAWIASDRIATELIDTIQGIRDCTDCGCGCHEQRAP